MTQSADGSFQELLSLGRAAALFDNRPLPSPGDIDGYIRLEERALSQRQEAGRKRQHPGSGPKALDDVTLSAEGKSIIKMFSNISITKDSKGLWEWSMGTQ